LLRSEMSMFMCWKSVMAENEKSLNTLSTPIFGACNSVLTNATGLHLTCIELLIIQSTLKSTVAAWLLTDVEAFNNTLFLTLFIVVKVKSIVDTAAFYNPPVSLDIAKLFENP